MQKIKVPHTKIASIYLKVPLEQAIEQNSYREGRVLVPNDVINSMFKNLKPPTLEEGFNEIYIIENNKPIKLLSKEKR